MSHEPRSHLLHKIENRHAVPYRRQETCTVRREAEISPAVNGAEKIGEL